MNIGRVLFIAIFVFATSTLLAVSSALESVKNSVMLPPALARELWLQQRQSQLTVEYQKNLTQILTAFVAKSPLNQSEVSNLENQLLTLTVPAELTDLHFKLVAALSTMEKPASQDKSTVRANLEKLTNQYGWLTSTLSLFLMRNF